MSWKNNAAMFWRNSSGYQKVTDHNRSSLEESIERIGNDVRMADGTLRRYTVAKKRTWNTDWTSLPSTNSVSGGLRTVDGGMAGEDIEAWARTTDGPFAMALRRGSAANKTIPTTTLLPYQNNDFYIVEVVITDFSKSVVKRGRVDLWDLSITLEEV